MKKRDVKYSKENIVEFFRKIRNFVSYNKKRIAGTTGVAAITSFITLTSAIAPTMGCNQDDIDAAMNAANNSVNEQTVKPESTSQDIDIPVDVTPTENPEKTEPIVSDPVEPVEEVNPRDMEAMYGIKDAPMYTDEEVAEAQENIKTKYEEYNDKSDATFFTGDKLEAIAEDYYKANQNFFSQLSYMTQDISQDSLSKLYGNRYTRYFYDEKNNFIFEIRRDGSLIIYGDSFVFEKSFINSSKIEELNFQPGKTCSEAAIMISKDSTFAYIYTKEGLIKYYKEAIDNYEFSLNSRNDSGIDKLIEIGYKDIPMEYECISFMSFDGDVPLEMK